MRVKFADTLKIINGKNQQKVEDPQGKYPIYGSGGIMGYANDYICPAETVIIGRKGSINKPIFADTPFWNVDTAFGLCTDKAKLFPKYLYYFCVNFDFECLNTTVTIPSLTKSNLLNIEIPLPPLDEQRRIAAVLDKVSNLITKRREQLDKLDELVKARFVEMFSDIKREDTLINLCNFIDYRGKTPEKTDHGLPFITAKNVKMHYMSFDTQEFISKETYDRVMTRGIPREGDVVFTTEAPLGNVCRIPHIGTEFYIGQRIITMQAKWIRPEYLEYALSSDKFVKKIAGKSSGSTVTGIRSKLLEQLTIPVPPLSLQEQFAVFTKETDKLKLTIQHSLDKMETLKKALMQEYFGM